MKSVPSNLSRIWGNVVDIEFNRKKKIWRVVLEDGKKKAYVYLTKNGPSINPNEA
jgi:hypothetical protein